MHVLARTYVTSLLGFALLTSVASAATISGRVSDANTNRFLPNVSVSIPELGVRATSTTGGEYVLRNVPAGEHRVVVSYIGYEDVTQTVIVGAIEQNNADVALGAEVLQLPGFVVSGEREGQARALQQKRTASNIMDIVSADSAGKLPDGNAAEAVRRLPGVFAEIDQNEGRYIVVRGIDANLNNITINGVNIGSTEAGGRGAGMDSVPAALIQQIKVNKTLTPDMDAQGIGASIDIVTESAFAHKGAFARGTLEGGYYNGPKDEFTERDTTPYSADATFGTQFGDGKFGIVLSASYSFRHYISNRRSGGGEWYPAAASGPGANIYFPAVQALFHYDVQRWRQGANLAFEYKPDKSNYYALRLTDNRFRDEEGREQNNFEFFRTAFPASFTETTARFTGGRATTEYRYYEQEHNITNYSFEGRNSFGSSQLTYQASVGNAEKITPTRQDWAFRTAANLTSDLDISQHYWKVTPEARFYDAATFPFQRVRIRHDDETEDNYSGKIDFKQDQQFFGHNGYWKVGAKYFSRDKGWNRDNMDYTAGTGANLFNLSQLGVSSPAHTMFDGAAGFRMSPVINLPAITALFKASPNYFPFDTAATFSDSNVTDFSLEESIAAGYAMAQIDFNKLTLMAGVRVENSKADVKQTELPNALGVVQPVRYKNLTKDYTNVLPGLNLKYNATSNLVVRAAWTNSIGRPNYPDMASASQFSYVLDAPGSSTYTISISEGNPELKPYEAMNFDLTTEYYFQKTGGIFSVGGFHKKIDNPVFSRAFSLRNGTYQGLSFSALNYTKPENADEGKISGVEINYQQQLRMLPAPFDGLGFSINFTASDSEVRLFGARSNDKLQFLKQAPKLYNVALYYEKYQFEARVAYTFTGAFQKSFGGAADFDVFQAEREIIDAKVKYRINRNVSVYGAVINLGEEPLDEYARYPNRNGATEAYWWTANFGVEWNWGR